MAPRMANGTVASIGVLTVIGMSTLISSATRLPTPDPGPAHAAARAAVQEAAGTTSADRALLNQYCVSCHNQRLKTAALSRGTRDLTDMPAGAQLWEKRIPNPQSYA